MSTGYDYRGADDLKKSVASLHMLVGDLDRALKDYADSDESAHPALDEKLSITCLFLTEVIKETSALIAKGARPTPTEQERPRAGTILEQIEQDERELASVTKKLLAETDAAKRAKYTARALGLRRDIQQYKDALEEHPIMKAKASAPAQPESEQETAS